MRAPAGFGAALRAPAAVFFLFCLLLQTFLTQTHVHAGFLSAAGQAASVDSLASVADEGAPSAPASQGGHCFICAQGQRVSLGLVPLLPALAQSSAGLLYLITAFSSPVAADDAHAFIWQGRAPPRI